MSTASILRDPGVNPWPLTREQFDKLVELGEFEGQHVELLEGALVEMTPQGEEHSDVISLLTTEIAGVLRARHGRRYLVRPQVPLAASPFSEPEPDLAIVELASRRPGTGHPRTALLVIEVAFSSQRIDLVHKAKIYAAAGVPEYWVVDLVRREVVVHERVDVHAGYTQLRKARFDEPLNVLGVSVCLAELLETDDPPAI